MPGTPVCLLHSLMPVETAREAFAVCECCHADLRIFSDGYACTDARSIALAAARAAKEGHWCVAGKARREQVDFGYWYCPDGRDAMTQSQFEDVEVEPQAFEWLFCVAAGFPFNVSCDNLEGDVEPRC